MKVEFGTFESNRPREKGVNLTKSRVSERRDLCNPLKEVDKSVVILLGWCTYPF